MAINTPKMTFARAFILLPFMIAISRLKIVPADGTRLPIIELQLRLVAVLLAARRGKWSHLAER